MLSCVFIQISFSIFISMCGRYSECMHSCVYLYSRIFKCRMWWCMGLYMRASPRIHGMKRVDWACIVYSVYAARLYCVFILLVWRCGDATLHATLYVAWVFNNSSYSQRAEMRHGHAYKLTYKRNNICHRMCEFIVATLFSISIGMGLQIWNINKTNSAYRLTCYKIVLCIYSFS